MSKTAKELEEEELERKRRKYNLLVESLASKGVRVLSSYDCRNNSCDLGGGISLERNDKERKFYLKPPESMKNEGIVIEKDGKPMEVIDFGPDGKAIRHYLLEGQVSVFPEEMLKGIKTQSFSKDKPLEAFVKPSEIAEAIREASELRAELRQNKITEQLKKQQSIDHVLPPVPGNKKKDRGLSRR